MIKIQQIWWHVEDQVKFSKGQSIRQVLDICTDQQFFLLDISQDLAGLKIKGRNINNELAFIEFNNKIKVNLGPLKRWQPIEDNIKLKHAKIELEYTQTDPKFTESWDGSYEGSFGITGPTRPEFYIKAPLGMKLDNEGNNVKIFLVKKKKDIISDVNFYNSQPPYVTQNNGKREYNFIIKQKDYAEIKEEYETTLTTNYEIELVTGCLIWCENSPVV